MKPGFWDYVREAFNARPIGMFIPPNWIGIGVFGLLSLLNPGFLVLGLGLECGYLWTLSTNSRFQRWVLASHQYQSRRQWQLKVENLIRQLGPETQRRYRSLEARCRAILEQQIHGATVAEGLTSQGEGLGRLLWVYLRLLMTRQAIEHIVREAAGAHEDADSLTERVGNLETRLKEESISEELRKSLLGQIEILRQRLEKRKEAREKMAFLDAELVRIQEQVELVREQAVLATDPETVSQRIDQITTTLGGTTQWIQEQQKIYGAVEDLLAEPPTVTLDVPAKEAQ